MADPAYIVNGVLTDGEAWVGIAHASLSLPAATVTWTSTDDGQVGDWSQYMDLVLVCYVRAAYAAASGDMYLQFNNDTGANYEAQLFYGNGSAASASAQTGQVKLDVGEVPYDTATSNVFGGVLVHLFDVNSGKYKSVLSQSAADRDGAGTVRVSGGTWQSQAAITEIDIIQVAGDHLAASSFSLFGILPRMVA